MAEIKLPVTTKFDEHLGWLYDAAGDLVLRAVGAESANLFPIAAALNAATTRAFEGLTVEVIGKMRHEVMWAAEAKGVERSEDRRLAEDTEFLARLQDFAAPVAPVAPAWQPIETAPRDRGPILLGSVGISTVGLWVDASTDAPDEMGSDAGWLDTAGSSFFPSRSFGALNMRYEGRQPTHWMPLPAAPEAQGGPEDA